MKNYFIFLFFVIIISSCLNTNPANPANPEKMDSLTSFYANDQSILLCQAYKKYFEIEAIDNQKELIIDKGNFENLGYKIKMQ